MSDKNATKVIRFVMEDSIKYETHKRNEYLRKESNNIETETSFKATTTNICKEKFLMKNKLKKFIKS